MRLLRRSTLFYWLSLSLRQRTQTSAALYNDTVGDATVGGALGPPAANLDLTSVEVNNTATDLIFKIILWRSSRDRSVAVTIGIDS